MSKLWFDIIVQGIGALGLLASILAFQFRSHKKIMLFRTANELLFALQYLLLGGYTGMLLNTFGTARNLMFAYQIEKGRDVKWSRLFFSLVFVVSGIVTWSGFPSVIITGSKVLSTAAYSLKNTVALKLLSLFTSSMWLIYDSMVFSLAGVLCDVLTIGSILLFFVCDAVKRGRERKESNEED